MKGQRQRHTLSSASFSRERDSPAVQHIDNGCPQLEIENSSSKFQFNPSQKLWKCSWTQIIHHGHSLGNSLPLSPMVIEDHGFSSKCGSYRCWVSKNPVIFPSATLLHTIDSFPWFKLNQMESLPQQRHQPTRNN